jgi:tetratricopeptide (TPR) repeat protein
MSFQSKTYRSTLFQSFKAIDAGEYKQVVKYYERHQKEILQLDFEEYFEILVVYTNALFEGSEYRKHILAADIVIETSIIENISMVNGQEIFNAMLFKKAASHYNLFEYKKATHVLQELVKIEPNNSENIRFLEHCLREEHPQIRKHVRAIAVLLFLLAALTVSIEVLFVRHFTPVFAPQIELLRNILFGFGLIVLSVGTFWHRLKYHNQVRKFIKEVKKEKKGY